MTSERAEVVDWVLSINPIPCPRPRITSKGWTYYPKKYQAWKTEAEDLFIEMMKAHKLKAFAGEVEVIAVFVVKRPKTTKLPRPKPDIDNYLKALLDAGTGVVWTDDHIISAVGASKAWSKPGEEGRIRIMISEVPSETE